MTPPTEAFYWFGEPVESLSREQLLEAIKRLATEHQSLRREIERMTPHVDWAAFLMAEGGKE